jgi:hypothetical protein
LVVVSCDYPHFVSDIDQPNVWVHRDMNHPPALLLPVVPRSADGPSVGFYPIAKGQPIAYGQCTIKPNRSSNKKEAQ